MLILAGGERGPPMDYEELKRWTRVTIACGVLVGRKPDANQLIPSVQRSNAKYYKSNTVTEVKE